MDFASADGNSARTTVRLHRALAASTNNKSGAYKSTAPLKNARRSFSDSSLSFSGRNHFRTTLVSTTQFRIAALFPDESIRRCRRTGPSAVEVLPVDAEFFPRGSDCAQT